MTNILLGLFFFSTIDALKFRQGFVKKLQFFLRTLFLLFYPLIVLMVIEKIDLHNIAPFVLFSFVCLLFAINKKSLKDTWAKLLICSILIFYGDQQSEFPWMQLLTIEFLFVLPIDRLTLRSQIHKWTLLRVALILSIPLFSLYEHTYSSLILVFKLGLLFIYFNGLVPMLKIVAHEKSLPFLTLLLSYIVYGHMLLMILI